MSNWLADTLIVLFLCACCIACVYFSGDLAAGPEPEAAGYFMGVN